MHCMQSRFYRHADLYPNLTLSPCLQSNTNAKAFKLAGFASCLARLRLTRSVAVKTRGINRGEPEWLPKGAEEEEEEEEEEEDYEDDVDAADLLMKNLEDPENMRKLIEDRIKKKQKTIFQAKTQSAEPMNVTFNNKGEEEEEEEDHYEDDADAADLLMGGLEDPEKMRKQIEDRVKKKQKTIFQAKTGSAEPMNVTFNNFDFSDSYIWIEFERAPSDNDLRIISGTMRSWFVLGHLGGYNSSNMQLTELPIDKQPSYDIVRANKDIEDAITFENIGDIEIQGKLGRIWVDIGNSDPLTLDVLINALRSLSSDYIGIRQLVFGGKRWGNWKEGKTSSQDKCKVWRI